MSMYEIGKRQFLSTSRKSSYIRLERQGGNPPPQIPNSLQPKTQIRFELGSYQIHSHLFFRTNLFIFTVNFDKHFINLSIYQSICLLYFILVYFTCFLNNTIIILSFRLALSFGFADECVNQYQLRRLFSVVINLSS